MFSSSPLRRLRETSRLAAIPDVIEVPPIGGNPARTVAIERATIDGTEFVLIGLGQQQSELYRITGALGDVVKMARRRGACGADTAILAAVRDLEASK